MKLGDLTAKERSNILRRRHEAKVRASAPPKFAKRDFPKADRGRVRDPGYLAFLRRLPCVACMVEGGNCGPTEAAHIRFSDARLGRINPGMQAKPSDQWATPLGRGHHQHDQHAGAERAFWERLAIEPGALSMALHTAYLAGGDGLAVLRQFTERRAA
jgi:hypothetical protein